MPETGRRPSRYSRTQGAAWKALANLQIMLTLNLGFQSAVTRHLHEEIFLVNKSCGTTTKFGVVAAFLSLHERMQIFFTTVWQILKCVVICLMLHSANKLQLGNHSSGSKLHGK